ncbi:MAG: protein-disulfide reductase DsbD [Pseudomonadales bacterium]
MNISLRSLLATMLVGACVLTGLIGQPIAALELTSPGDPWLDDEPKFLPVDQAFVLSTELAADGAVLVRWDMVDGYYLYRHRFGFDVRTSAEFAESDVVLGAPEIAPGKKKFDDYFGDVEVYYHQAQARVPVESGSGAVEVGISYQGCADMGLCYPPETKWVAFNLATGGGPSALGGSAPGGSIVPQTEARALASMLADGGLMMSLFLFFIAGLGLAFTPCVLPMVPILSSIIVGDSDNINRTRAFTLSVAYVLGMALTYAAVGTAVGLFGASLNLQAALQSAPVLSAFAVVFVVLSLSMFGFYELQLPQNWQNGLNVLGQKAGGGKHLSVTVMGSLSSLIVSPCVSAPLAGALIYLSSTGDAVLGGTALLALGLGMGVPLIVIGASGGHLLPRAGAWMNSVKAVFGVLLLAVAVWLLERVVPPGITLLLWAALAIGSGVYLGALDFAPREGWGQLWKASGAISFVYGVLLLIGAASGAEDPLNPLQNVVGARSEQPAEQLTWYPVDDLADLQAGLQSAGAAGQPVLLDLYADWCISCKVMERSVFPKPEVASRLARFRLLRADVTDNNAQHKALLERFGLFGPPSMMFFAEDGREMTEVRIQGEIGAAALATHLAAILKQGRTENFSNIASNVGEIRVKSAL